ncbi:hypothetical protein E2562_018052 [Oryza meyeriana var. granulata]|uniref:Uncharacterized protein n=1 Tax=Oryza meyeriana var. granulata TaxID=110450 RepID=A0A6G1CQZ7_9ORYZ|nr:hypothetical protein E2562_018052 [Oryza meyeriana var. granulata]
MPADRPPPEAAPGVPPEHDAATAAHLGRHARPLRLTAAGMSPQLTSHLQGGLHVEPYMTPPIMYGDCLYWLPLEENLGSNGRKIVAFDTKAEHFIWIGTPSIFYDLWAPIQLLTIQGELAMAVTNLSDPELNHAMAMCETYTHLCSSYLKLKVCCCLASGF